MECQVAFKEWAVVCEALARGEQTIILRKGGIHEGRAGFRVAHPQFWFLPTNFHAEAGAIIPSAHGLLHDVAQQSTPGGFLVRHFAVVEQVRELSREEDALALAGLHIWSEATVRQRFHYKQPGLYCLAVRVWTMPAPVQVNDTPEIAGCRSWVELPEPIVASELSPAVDDATFQQMLGELTSRLSR